jgi:hypothetical protein
MGSGCRRLYSTSNLIQIMRRVHRVACAWVVQIPHGPRVLVGCDLAGAPSPAINGSCDPPPRRADSWEQKKRPRGREGWPPWGNRSSAAVRASKLCRGASPWRGECFRGPFWWVGLFVAQESLTRATPTPQIRHDRGWVPAPRRSPVSCPPMGSTSTAIRVEPIFRKYCAQESGSGVVWGWRRRGSLAVVLFGRGKEDVCEPLIARSAVTI